MKTQEDEQVDDLTKRYDSVTTFHSIALITEKENHKEAQQGFKLAHADLDSRMKDEVRHLRREHDAKQNEQQLNNSSVVNARENELILQLDTHTIMLLTWKHYATN